LDLFPAPSSRGKRAQFQVKRRPSWISRGLRVAVIWPNVLPATAQVGLLTAAAQTFWIPFGSSWVWLNALMKSARNWRRVLLPRYQFFDSVMSHWLTPGRRKGARPVLP
jgi:hypothetical protein